MDRYQYRKNNKNLMMVHVILLVKYRKPLLLGVVRDDAKQFLYETCVEHHWYVKPMETDRDHVHILLQYSPSERVSDIVRTLKQYSTYRLWQRHATMLRKHFWKKQTFWSGGYFVATVGQVSQATVEHYIENQG